MWFNIIRRRISPMAFMYDAYLFRYPEVTGRALFMSYNRKGYWVGYKPDVTEILEIMAIVLSSKPL